MTALELAEVPVTDRDGLPHHGLSCPPDWGSARIKAIKRMEPAWPAMSAANESKYVGSVSPAQCRCKPINEKARMEKKGRLRAGKASTTQGINIQKKAGERAFQWPRC